MIIMKSFIQFLIIFILGLFNNVFAASDHETRSFMTNSAIKNSKQNKDSQQERKRYLQNQSNLVFDGVIFIDVGYEHNCVVFQYGDNNMQCWGSNESGQLGLGDVLSRGNQPNQMGDDLRLTFLGRTKPITKISLGGFHTCALFDGDTAKCFGDNSYGQLILGDINNRGDQPNEMGDNLPFIKIGKGEGILNIVTGFMHTCVYITGNRVSCFGNNEHGQLGLGDRMPRGGSIRDIDENIAFVDIPLFYKSYFYTSGTANHTCILISSGLSCWGRNSKGQLGIGSTNNIGDESEEMGKNLPIIEIGSLKYIPYVTIGGENTCFSRGSSVYCFGDNQYGQLALGNTKNVGKQKGEMGSNLKSMKITSKNKFTWASVGSGFICVRIGTLRLKCFGKNSNGELGQGDTINRGGSLDTIGDFVPDFSTGTYGLYIDQILSGYSHTCVLIVIPDHTMNMVKCFGNGSKGQLGYGDSSNRGSELNQMGDNLPKVSLRTIPQWFNNG